MYQTYFLKQHRSYSFKHSEILDHFGYASEFLNCVTPMKPKYYKEDKLNYIMLADSCQKNAFLFRANDRVQS